MQTLLDTPHTSVMKELIKDILNYFSDVTPDAVMTVVLGVIALSITIHHFNQKYIRDKQAKVFNTLSESISESISFVRKIKLEIDTTIKALADTADKFSGDVKHLSDEERLKEIENRLKDLEKVLETQKTTIAIIYDSTTKVLSLIENIEKSTLISDGSRVASRYLYYFTLDQHKLITAISNVLFSFKTTPVLGEKPNVSPDTFNEFVTLVALATARYEDLLVYLDDMEVILHNDLIGKLFKKAKHSQNNSRHLTITGFRDDRTKQSLR